MNKKNNSNINISKVSGNVIISKNQKGGTTANDSSNENPNKKSVLNHKGFILLGIIGSILTVLGYFGFQPKHINSENKEITNNKFKEIDTVKKSLLNNSQDSIESKKRKIEELNKKPQMEKKENTSNKNPINLGSVTGDVVISQHQTGGITAHTVYNLDIPDPEYLTGAKSLNVKVGDHFNSKFIFIIESKVPVKFVEVRINGKRIYNMTVFPSSYGGGVYMEGPSGQTDWGYYRTILNGMGEYEISIDSKEIEDFNKNSFVFVDKYK